MNATSSGSKLQNKLEPVTTGKYFDFNQQLLHPSSLDAKVDLWAFTVSQTHEIRVDKFPCCQLKYAAIFYNVN